METFSRVEIVGRLHGADPLRYTPSSRTFAHAFIIVDRAPGLLPSKTAIEVEAWDEAAKKLACAKRGLLVRVEGEIEYRERTEKRSGRERRKLVVRAQNVALLLPVTEQSDEDPRPNSPEDIGHTR